MPPIFSLHEKHRLLSRRIVFQKEGNKCVGKILGRETLSNFQSSFCRALGKVYQNSEYPESKVAKEFSYLGASRERTLRVISGMDDQF